MSKTFRIGACVVVLLGMTAYWWIGESTLDPQTKIWLDAPLAPDRDDRGPMALLELEQRLPTPWRDHIKHRCDQISDTCRAWLEANPSLVSQAFTDESLVQAFEVILAQPTLALTPLDPAAVGGGRAFYQLMDYSVVADVVSAGHIQPDTVLQLARHTRRHMAQAGTLIDKILMQGAWMSVIIKLTSEVDLGQFEKAALDEITRPLDADEMSLLAPLQGELRVAQQYFETERYIPVNRTLNVWQRHLQQVADVSALTPDVYWRQANTPLPTWRLRDKLIHPLPYLLLGPGMPDYHFYLEALQRDAVRLLVIRRVVLGDAKPLPSGWQWEVRSAEICAEPSDVVQSDAGVVCCPARRTS